MVGVRVPATSANWGPAFDAAGIALSMYNRFYAEEVEEGLFFEGFLKEFSNDKNLVYVAMKKAFLKMNYQPKGLKIKMDGEIPDSRGLGSSASCIVGGVMLANEISGAGFEKSQILKIATEIEGHPDNVAPAIFGSFVISIVEGDEVEYDRIDLDGKFNYISLIPDFRLSTELSRKVLPEKIDYFDGVFNLSRVSLLVSALHKGDYKKLKLALEDKLHQSYRGGLIPGYFEIAKFVKEESGKGFFLSGAGPSLLVVDEKQDNEFLKRLEEFLSSLELDWRIECLEVDSCGARII